MMMDSEHQAQLRDSMVLEMASGTLDPVRSLMLMTQMSICRKTHAKVRLAESIGGVLMERHCDPCEMTENSLEKVLLRIDQETELADEPSCASHENTATACRMEKAKDEAANFPDPLRRYIVSQNRPVKWSRLGKGVKFAHISGVAKGPQLYVMDVAPGVKTPEHTHEGNEYTLVIQGAYEDVTGVYKRGDLVITDDSVVHEPVADPETGCVCVVVTDMPIRFTRGPLRFFNLFVR